MVLDPLFGQIRIQGSVFRTKGEKFYSFLFSYFWCQTSSLSPRAPDPGLFFVPLERFTRKVCKRRLLKLSEILIQFFFQSVNFSLLFPERFLFSISNKYLGPERLNTNEAVLWARNLNLRYNAFFRALLHIFTVHAQKLRAF